MHPSAWQKNRCSTNFAAVFINIKIGSIIYESYVQKKQMDQRDGFRAADLRVISICMVLCFFTQLSVVSVFSCYNNHCITKPKFLSLHFSCVSLQLLVGIIYISVVSFGLLFYCGLIYWKVDQLFTGL